MKLRIWSALLSVGLLKSGWTLFREITLSLWQIVVVLAVLGLLVVLLVLCRTWYFVVVIEGDRPTLPLSQFTSCTLPCKVRIILLLVLNLLLLQTNLACCCIRKIPTMRWLVLIELLARLHLSWLVTYMDYVEVF